MVISRPCLHPDCPPRDGFIRGQYESIEFVQEIPLRPKKTSSTTHLRNHDCARASSSSPNRADPLETMQNSLNKEREDETGLDNVQGDVAPRPSLDHSVSWRGRKRGKTISFAESRGSRAKGEAVDMLQDDSDDLAETNPVEWVMITRSDPGGSVPRFLVERGTPSGIVADASKFVDWAFNKEHLDFSVKTGDTPDSVVSHGHKDSHELEPYQTNDHLAGVDRAAEVPDIPPSREIATSISESQDGRQNQSTGLLANVANIAYSGIESYAPQLIIDRLPGHRSTPSTGGSMTSPSNQDVSNSVLPTEDLDGASPSSSGVTSFASAEEHFGDALSLDGTLPLLQSSNTTDVTDMTPHEKELRKLNDRKKTLDERLARSREKELKDKEEITSREEERLRKAEEKHAREVQKQEQKYRKEVAKLEAKRVKDAAREEERKKKAEDKDEKARLMREKEELKQQLEVVFQERDILQTQVGALQRENTALVAKIGKMGDGQHLLKDVRTELFEGPRSRSGSLRKNKPTGSALALEATVLADEGEGPAT